MPTVLRLAGFSVMIFVHDHEPIHVHVRKAGGEIVINVRDISVRDAWHMSGRDARRAQAIVAENQEFLIAEWKRIGPKP